MIVKGKSLDDFNQSDGVRFNEKGNTGYFWSFHLLPVTVQCILIIMLSLGLIVIDRNISATML